jgi:hypothetical protein
MEVPTEQQYLGTGEIGRRFGIISDSVCDWMTLGVKIDGVRVYLKHIRMGRLRYTTEEWLEEFKERCNPGTASALPAEARARQHSGGSPGQSKPLR